MKFSVALLACLSVFLIQSAAAEDSESFSLEDLEDFPEIQLYASEEETESGNSLITPRITCDILGGKFNHAACAVHCILKGYRGGYCDSKAVCNCRR
ncbi:UNVERIFIED_CONTAM: hypothetical protein PYX00_002001 [Menopon gallinae]|uniref:Invertebrate defensins family profile domain-containing protein n=1 Tax=Menopon gallinae TaxID=328185 RepID=A0AAW2IF82_9NEOP